jgi:hypothetical protein
MPMFTAISEQRSREQDNRYRPLSVPTQIVPSRLSRKTLTLSAAFSGSAGVRAVNIGFLSRPCASFFGVPCGLNLTTPPYVPIQYSP